MPRRGAVSKRRILPDPKYKNVTVAKFINNLLKDGKKSIAETILYRAFDIVEAKMSKRPVEVFKIALSNVKPLVEVKSRRVGGSTYQVPVEIRPERRESLAIRWLIACAKGRSEKTMYERLAGEFLDAFNKKGATIKKRDDVHRMADANKAFAHYRW